MKKFVILSSIVGLCVIFFSGCASMKMGGAIKGKEIITEGWIDDDTFQVIAWGEASPDAVGEAQWRNQAKEGAQMMAEKRVIEKFKGYVLESKGYTKEGANVEVVVSKEVEGFAKGGEIVKVTFDEKNRACEIVYKVRGPNLKRRVESGIQVKEIQPKIKEAE